MKDQMAQQIGNLLANCNLSLDKMTKGHCNLPSAMWHVNNEAVGLVLLPQTGAYHRRDEPHNLFISPKKGL